MKLSRAILVVILMHAVAVGGVLAFSLLHEKPAELATPRPASPPAALAAKKSAPSFSLTGSPEAAKPVAARPVLVVKPAPTPATPSTPDANSLLRDASTGLEPAPGPLVLASVGASAPVVKKASAAPASTPAKSPKVAKAAPRPQIRQISHTPITVKRALPVNSPR